MGFSVSKGTLRGLHYQIAPALEAKLVRCTQGSVFDVVVDPRPTSPTYQFWYGSCLSSANGRMLYVPEGCAHGCQSLEDNTEIYYMASAFFSPEAARGVRYDDPAFGIRWPLPVSSISDVGMNRSDLSDGQITYFYDQDICFTRLSFPHMLSATNVPPGCGSIQAEVYFCSKYRPPTRAPEDLIDPVIADLRRTGILREDDTILTRHAILVPYANVIFDLERAKALETVHGYLRDVGINYCGRYGDWGYMWTDESYVSGERAAGVGAVAVHRLRDLAA
jgi:dTDP-4-dehydrorhamnose 3,5-epimerase